MKSKKLTLAVIIFFGLGSGWMCRTPQTTSSEKTNPEYTGNFSRAEWPTRLKEGWLTDQIFQALVSDEGNLNRDELQKKCMVRLSWLLLLDGYDVTRQDQSIAEKLATSRLIEDFGDQTEFYKSDDQRQFMLIRRTSENLKNIWQILRPKLENKFPHLTNLRKPE